MTRLRKFGIAGLAILVGIVFCASRIPPEPAPASSNPWRSISPLEEAFAQPLHPPALLEEAVIWRPLAENRLVYTALDGSRELQYDWLIDAPLQWTAQAGASLHLTWRTVDGELYNAVLSAMGEQLTAPVQITEVASDFETQPLDGGSLLVVWRQDSALWARVIDSAGRPLASSLIQAPVEDFTLGEDGFLAWVSSGELFTAQIEVSGAVPTLGNPQQIEAFDVPEEAWLSSLFFARVRASHLLVWGFGQAEQPDTEIYQGAFVSDGEEWAFPLDLPLRWAVPSAAGDHLVLAVLVEDEWRQAILDLRDNTLEILNDLPPATGGLPAMRGDTLVWVSLDEQAAPSLIIRTKNPAWGMPIATASAVPTENWRDALREGLEASPWGLIWLVAPMLGLEWLRSQERWYTLPAALALYWIGKTGFSFGLFSGYPSLFAEWEISEPFGFGVLVLLLINLVAALIGYTGWGDTPARVRYAAYFLTDALLTFLIFWSHVE